MPPPSHIFVIRHGHRLDAADKQWHLSSPTPYDPPLTYSGWAQSRATGERIAAILGDFLQQQQQQQQQSKFNTSNDQDRNRRKRYKFVIHSSPFLRCIQTSVAISAGLASRPSLMADARRILSSLQIAQMGEQLGGPPAASTARPSRPVGKRAVLRIDAFLGEWLSPTYFELITPPPGSVMMLASAKASLLKHENYQSYPHMHTRGQLSPTPSQTSSSGHLWASPTTPRSVVAAPTPLESMGNMEEALPQTPNPRDSRPSTALTASSEAEADAYDPPVPSFSISKSAPIPDGYVNHAKDACVVVDYQWDSMRPPYDWGDGGELPEEWSDMHKRFSRGLQKMVDWYTAEPDPATAVTSEAIRPNDPGASETTNQDEDQDETVVIIVSHGAGCNAMIGAIEHKPALMDVGLSSISMASLKPQDRRSPLPLAPPGPTMMTTTTTTTRAPGSVRIHDMYDLKLRADTDHLRPSAAMSTALRSPMGNVFDGNGRSGGRANHHSFSTGSATSRSDWGDSEASTSTYRRSSVGRSIASFRAGLQKDGSGLGSCKPMFTPSGLSRTPSLGLWSPPSSVRVEEESVDDEEAELIDLRRSDTGTSNTSGMAVKDRQASAANEDHEDEKDHGPQLGSPSEETEVVRYTTSSKRRWTVNEHS